MSKYYAIKSYCSKKKKPIGVQFKQDTVYPDRLVAVGRYPVDANWRGKEEPQPDVKGNLYLGMKYYNRGGCIECGNKYLFVCHSCGSLVCYDGYDGELTCPKCKSVVKVYAQTSSDQGRILSSTPVSKPAEVVLAIDISGSMSGDPLKDAKEAVKEYVRNFPNSSCSFALVTFESKVNPVCSMTKNKEYVLSLIGNLEADGGTKGPLPDIEKWNMFSKKDKAKRYIVLLTDGEWWNIDENKLASARLRQDGIEIFAIGLGGSTNLMDIADSKNTILIDDSGSFGRAFANIIKSTGNN